MFHHISVHMEACCSYFQRKQVCISNLDASFIVWNMYMSVFDLEAAAFVCQNLGHTTCKKTCRCLRRKSTKSRRPCAAAQCIGVWSYHSHGLLHGTWLQTSGKHEWLRTLRWTTVGWSHNARMSSIHNNIGFQYLNSMRPVKLHSFKLS